VQNGEHTCVKFRCPICNKPVKTPVKEHPQETKFFPFCSERCKLIDLGLWLEADYKITSKPPENPEE
jgi:endogenous inhibitor of DNA gyrase (YacG/DUF329 family)